MREERVREALAAHVEGRGGQAPAERIVEMSRGMTEEEQHELASLIVVADRLEERMERVQPSATFVQSLRAELVEEARRRTKSRERRHRVAVISAAVAGAAVSIASLVGGVVVLIKWLRTRTEARQASTA
jgi:hypothetical protein